MARIMLRQREHGLDRTGVDTDIGCHHDDIAWPQTFDDSKKVQQLVL